MFLNAAYNGIGRSVGAMIGGKIQGEVGTVVMFNYVTMLNLMCGVLLVLYSCTRKATNYRNPTPVRVERYSELVKQKIQ